MSRHGFNSNLDGLIYRSTMLHDVSTAATLPIRNYDSIKRHIFSIRLTLRVVSCREPIGFTTDFVSSRKGFKGSSMIYVVRRRRIAIRN